MQEDGQTGPAATRGSHRVGHFDPDLPQPPSRVVGELAGAATTAAANVRGEVDFEDDVGQRVATYVDVQARWTIPRRMEVDRLVGLQNELPAAFGIALHAGR